MLCHACLTLSDIRALSKTKCTENLGGRKHLNGRQDRCSKMETESLPGLHGHTHNFESQSKCMAE